MKKEPKFRLSNSTMNAFLDYKDGKECGLHFKALYIDKTIESIPSDAMKKGIWFEFMSTGTLPRNKIIPLPETLKNGNLSADYQNLTAQLQNFKNLMLTWHDESVCYGSIITIDDPIPAKSVMDILANDFIRDIKVTGNLEGRDEFGWGGDLHYKKALSQAKFYVWIIWKSIGKIVPFYFDVYSYRDPLEMKVIKVTVSLDTLEQCERDYKAIYQIIEFENEIGYEAHPDLVRCSECQLKETCEFFTNVKSEILLEL